MMVDTSKLTKPTNRKGAPPAPADTNANLQQPPAGQKVPLQLKITPELRREFRTYAAERDLELSNLFRLVWSYYREHHG
jgi:hypothetical protein